MVARPPFYPPQAPQVQLPPDSVLLAYPGDPTTEARVDQFFDQYSHYDPAFEALSAKFLGDASVANIYSANGTDLEAVVALDNQLDSALVATIQSGYSLPGVSLKKVAAHAESGNGGPAIGYLTDTVALDYSHPQIGVTLGIIHDILGQSAGVFQAHLAQQQLGIQKEDGRLILTVPNHLPSDMAINRVMKAVDATVGATAEYIRSQLSQGISTQVGNFEQDVTVDAACFPQTQMMGPQR